MKDMIILYSGRVEIWNFKRQVGLDVSANRSGHGAGYLFVARRKKRS